MLEKSILRSMVEYPNAINPFLNIAKKEYFSPKAQEILNVILSLYQKKALSLEALNDLIPKSLENDDFYVNFLVAQVNPNYLNQADEFVKIYKLKLQEKIATEILQASADKKLIDISLYAKDLDLQAKALTNFTQWEQEYNKKPKKSLYKSGVDFLDTCFDGGFELAQLVLISGDPEAGKTMLGLQILEYITNKHKVLFFSLEFTIDQYIARRASYKHFNKDNLFIDNSADNLESMVETIKAAYTQGIRVFLIDSQMRVLSDSSLNMEERETLKFSTLAKLAHRLEILIFFIIQNSKSDADNPSGTKKGGHESSITLRIERVKPSKDDIAQKGKEFSENERVIIVKKNKQTGKHFKEKVAFNPKNQRFSTLKEREKEYKPQEQDYEEIDIAEI